MVELLRYLEVNGFSAYICTGGNRDFMRTITGEIYGIPPERVVGSSNGLRYAGGERPALRLLVVHDDADREFDYTAGAEAALARADREGWALVSVKRDWGAVFSDAR